MNTLFKLASGIAVALASTSAVQAQEWSAAQKEVWSHVETYWQANVNEDIEGLMAYFDDEFLGWSNRQALPRTKADVRNGLVHALESREVVLWSIKPVGIKIHGDIALVHFYFSKVIRAKDGTEKTEKVRWTDILKKKGQRWVQVGDHGGADPAN